MTNPYRVLQVDPSAEPEVIEAAYRRLVRKYHPDINTAPAAQARMRDLIEAYAIVRDPARRAVFDRRQGPWSRWRRLWRRTVRPPGPASGPPLNVPEDEWRGRPPCMRHAGWPAVGKCHVCKRPLCASCASLVRPAGCAPCVWRRGRRVQLRAAGSIAGFAVAFGLALALTLGTIRLPLAVALLAAYVVSATALGIAVMAGRMWRAGWQDEPRDQDLGFAFLAWLGLLIGWVATPVLLVKMARDVDRGGRLAAIAAAALMEA